MAAVRACERDIADAALLIANTGPIASTRPHAREETADTVARADALALRAFASHPLVGSLHAARSLAATVLKNPVLKNTVLKNPVLETPGLPMAPMLPSYPIDKVVFSGFLLSDNVFSSTSASQVEFC
jgi:hypothetical protein